MCISTIQFNAKNLNYDNTNNLVAHMATYHCSFLYCHQVDAAEVRKKFR